MKNDPKEINLLSRRRFIKGLAAGTLLLAGGAYFAQGPLYRQAVNGMQSLTGNLHASFLRQMITTDAATSRVLMCKQTAGFPSPRWNTGLKGRTIP